MLTRRGTIFKLTAGVLLACFISFLLILRSPSLREALLLTLVPEEDVDTPGNDTVTQSNDTTILPPLFPDLAKAEEKLPQHNETLPYPEGRNAKFLRFGNEMWG